MAPHGVVLQAQRRDGPPLEPTSRGAILKLKTKRWDKALIECDISVTVAGPVHLAHLVIGTAHRMQLDALAKAKGENEKSRYKRLAHELDGILAVVQLYVSLSTAVYSLTETKCCYGAHGLSRM